MKSELQQRLIDNVARYLPTFIIAAGLFLAFALAVDLFEIHIYAHDSAYYTKSYLYKLKEEGRWLYYLLFPITSQIPGKVAVFSNILFLFLFIFVVSKRWTKSVTYSLILSLLVIQATPLMEALRWPAVPIVAFPTLLLAALVSPHVNVYVFYVLFGVLLFGTNSFYLLPLAHLHLLKEPHIRENLRVLLFRIVPAWALGFISGFVFSLLMVYALTGQTGFKIADWRQPNPVRGLDGLTANTINAFGLLKWYVAGMFGDIWRKLFMLSALLIGFYRTNKHIYIPAAVLALCIIGSHFILTIPTGITVSFRTALAAWIGVLVMFFFFPDIKRRQYLLLLPLALLMAIQLYSVNHKILNWYATITNTYYNELLRIVPWPPRLYRGVIFLSASEEVFEMNSFLIDHFHLNPGKTESLNEDFHWRPMAFEAGFESVVLCGRYRNKEHPAICKRAFEEYERRESANPSHSGMYRVVGQQDGFLLVALNNDLDLQKWSLISRHPLKIAPQGQ